ncbi:MAG: hypothetical protein ACREKH_01965 [Candidatus Rokuibacteriota bacterium]
MSKVKEQARQIVDRLPEDATWDDVMYELYVTEREADAPKAPERRPGARSRRSAG